MADIHVGDIGTEFRLTITDQDGAAVNLATATVLEMVFHRPSSAGSLTKTASLYTDGTDGIIKYVSASGDLTPPGRWEVQGYVEVGSWKGHSDQTEFQVKPNLR